ncbi:AAA family ATPase [Geomonas sp. Red69]|uniref:DEAD/DEAH box helicase n=1 Tax=Geomonas diazotrophica TaxID=2843197 RepID=UPI001C10C1E6|nr:AAA domain-containing protein [Geomonas diazotrophica]MBU5638838.1 AAA family ATPase [Geomonas diazotrophica]
MHLNEFRFLAPDLYTFRSLDGALQSHLVWADVNEVSLTFSSTGYYLHHGKKVCPVSPDDSSSERIRGMVTRGNTQWVLRRHKSGTFDLQAVEVGARIQLEFKIGVDEGVVELLRLKNEIPAVDMDRTLQWLTDEFISAGVDGTPRIFACHYGSGEGDFQILGRQWCGRISRRKDAPPRLVKLTRQTGQRMVPCLLEGELAFIDASDAKLLLDPVAHHALERALRENNGGYLELWKEYGRTEWQKALKSARSLGTFRYREVQQAGDEYFEWRFTPKSREELISFRERWGGLEATDDFELEVGEVAPPWLVAPDLNVDPLDMKTRTKSIHGKVRLDRDSVVLRVDERFRQASPPAKGVLYASLTGHLTVQQRRERAKQEIDRGKRLPQLRYILEGIAFPVVVDGFPRRKFAGITQYAREIFRGPPTEKQNEAVSVAMNTPDIAIIVGPPGTGKTQVIAAIQRRLAQELRGQSLQHEVLISSFQHDAVENALARTEVFGLPPYKVGERGRRAEDANDPVEGWCSRKSTYVGEILQKIEADEPHVPILRTLNREIAILRVSHLSPSERAERLSRVSELLARLSPYGLRLSIPLRERWEAYLQRADVLRDQTRNYRVIPAPLMLAVRSLRATASGFADDGSDRAWRCLQELRRRGISLDVDQWSLLEAVSETTDAPGSDSLEALRRLKESLLDALLPDYRPPAIKSFIDEELAGVLNDIVTALEEPIRNSRRGVASVLADFRDALVHEPDKVRNAAREYCSIVGATCQQSASDKMASLKELSKTDGATSVEFDTVIIDEAARANPLDLIIPMAMARKRIILVGDHLQLPHLLDPEIEGELGERLNLQKAQKDAMKQSLFERLVTQLRSMKEVDGKTRVVMLDTQYRMHPVLGQFVSQNFYEKVHEPPLLPGRPAEDFAHSLPGYEGKVCAWLNVPHDDGGEERSGGSRRRKAEARKIGKEVKRLMAAAPDLSIGVITFYSAQRDLLMHEFLSYELTEESSEGIRIKPELANSEDGSEKLRIGTVDAFQGKEFDVVLLSIVRSSKPSVTSPGSEASWNNRFGFLRLANRMNVAMSRQRRLLVAVGDIAMADGSDAQEAVPALSAFLNLCRGPYGSVC